MARSKRILFLAELTKGYHTVLDIGTDHGLVLERAFELGYIKEGIASDLREKPLKSAENNLKNYPVTFVISDGFLAIRKPFDLAIIAGMGAHLICDIMDHAPKKDITYILQSNDKTDILREYLMNHGFMILDEYLVKDKFFYIVLKVKRGFSKLSHEDLILGPVLKTKPESRMFYDHKIEQIDKIYEKTDDFRKEELDKMRKIYKNI
ncbi:MAG: class I SAM-dependent methyltransferase [Acholeplasmataceae bacterium]|nr:class I SAM-dependent methyltransferase [Acholeplasmataceae bacterium]